MAVTEGGGGGGGEREDCSGDEITPINKWERARLSELKAMECEQTGQGRSAGASVVLINVKGTAGHTHKVNGEGSDWVCKTDRGSMSVRLAEWQGDDERDVQLSKRAFHEYSVDAFHHFHNCRFSLKSMGNSRDIKETSLVRCRHRYLAYTEHNWNKRSSKQIINENTSSSTSDVGQEQAVLVYRIVSYRYVKCHWLQSHSHYTVQQPKHCRASFFRVKPNDVGRGNRTICTVTMTSCSFYTAIMSWSQASKYCRPQVYMQTSRTDTNTYI